MAGTLVCIDPRFEPLTHPAPEFLISSMGGVGTTAVMEFFNSRKRINDPERFLNPLKHPIAPPVLPSVRKAVFLFGDPMNALLSIFRRDCDAIHLVNVREAAHRLPDFPPGGEREAFRAVARRWYRDLDDYLEQGIDHFRTGEQVDGWLSTPSDYPVLFVRYETLWEHVPELLEHLEVRGEVGAFPARRRRRSDWRAEPELRRRRLRRLYGALQERLRELPDLWLRRPGEAGAPAGGKRPTHPGRRSPPPSASPSSTSPGSRWASPTRSATATGSRSTVQGEAAGRGRGVIGAVPSRESKPWLSHRYQVRDLGVESV